MRLRFYTSTPLNVARGSGTYNALSTLGAGLRARGVEVQIVAPKFHLPNHTAERLFFNRWIAGDDRSRCDATVGVDLDGYRVAGRPGGPVHIAAIKGVIADELRFERGVTRALLGIQARCEKEHVTRASLVTTTSKYSARRIAECYGVPPPAAIIGEPIDLARWQELLRANPAEPDPRVFTVLCVCRFYARKRVDVLLRAASLLRKEIENLRLRIVGGGSEDARLRALAWDLQLTDKVEWLGTVGDAQLAGEYNRCDVFCLPSVQEGFGLAFVEAMAAAKPIVAARAGAVPEVAPQALFAEPDSPQALAHQLTILQTDPKQRIATGQEGRRRAEQFDAGVVAKQFQEMVESLLNGRL